MLEHAILQDRFAELLAKEREAERLYAHLAAAVDNPDLRAQIEELRRHKQRHITLAERLLEIVD